MERSYCKYFSKTLKYFVGYLSISIWFSQIIHCQIDSSLIAKIDQLVSNTIKENSFPGFAIGIINNKNVLYAKGFGVMKLGESKPVTTSSIFHMASVTKTFVATAIMQLVEQNKISLKGHITDYLPYFKLKDQRYKIITIQQLLNHTSGMPDVENYHWETPEYDDGALERYIRNLKDLTLISTPGQEFHYSNIGFEVLGDIIAKVSGESFELYIKNHILKPLGMHKSSLLLNQVDQQLLTSPHYRDNTFIKVSPVFPYNRPHAPSSTLYSNIDEMMHWAMANLNHGELNGQRILNDSTYHLLWHSGAYVSGEKQMGLCWFIENRLDHYIVMHDGVDQGFTSSLILLPKDSVAIVTMRNFLPGHGYRDTDISKIVLDVILKDLKKKQEN